MIHLDFTHLMQSFRSSMTHLVFTSHAKCSMLLNPLGLYLYRLFIELLTTKYLSTIIHLDLSTPFWTFDC